MKEHLSRVLFKTCEGIIFFSASFIYLAIALFAKFSPSIASIFGFIGFMALFMPGILLLMFLKIHAYRRDFQSTWFNSCFMLFVALVPVITVVKSAIFR